MLREISTDLRTDSTDLTHNIIERLRVLESVARADSGSHALRNSSVAMRESARYLRSWSFGSTPASDGATTQSP